MKPLTWIASAGPAAPWLCLGLFLASSFLMIWRLERMAAGGLEGSALGTLIMPYCTGMGNLIFVAVMISRRGGGAEVAVNCLVNNITNLTLLIGLPAALWGMSLAPSREDGPPPPRQRASIMETLWAAVIFTGAAWAAGRSGRITFTGGVLLTAMFLGWQGFHLAHAVRNKANWSKHYTLWTLGLDLALLALGSYAIYLSTDWLVGWVSNIKTGFVSAPHLGWLSGWVEVLPNAALAFYYGWKRRPEVVYASQVGDGHICIPLCLGIFALCRPLEAPALFGAGAALLIAVAAAHLVCVGWLGRLPRVAGWALIGAYGLFLWAGLGK